MITSIDEAIERAIRMVGKGKVKTIDGRDIDIVVDTLYMHGDSIR